MVEGNNRRDTVLTALAVIGVLALTGWGLYSLMGDHGSGHKKPPKISLLPDTPPPPPPPPKEKPPEPKEVKEVKVEQAKKEDAPPPDQSLKMEGAAGDGPSAFAAGKVTNEDLSKLGAGGDGNAGGLFNPFNSYAAEIKAELQRYLGRRSELKKRPYKIEVRLWVVDGGRIKRFELLGSTNDSDIDEAIRGALASLPTFSESPPANMPQPIKLRIVTGGSV